MTRRRIGQSCFVGAFLSPRALAETKHRRSAERVSLAGLPNMWEQCLIPTLASRRARLGSTDPLGTRPHAHVGTWAAKNGLPRQAPVEAKRSPMAPRQLSQVAKNLPTTLPDPTTTNSRIQRHTQHHDNDPLESTSRSCSLKPSRPPTAVGFARPICLKKCACMPDTPFIACRFWKLSPRTPHRDGGRSSA